MVFDLSSFDLSSIVFHLMCFTSNDLKQNKISFSKCILEKKRKTFIFK